MNPVEQRFHLDFFSVSATPSAVHEEDTLLKFPCKFPIKVVGHNCADFDMLVIEIVRRHSKEFSEDAINARISNGGRYVSVTINILARSKKQLDAIYQDLCDSEAVLMAL